MEELRIIVKNPTDGDPLDTGCCFTAQDKASYNTGLQNISVGWKATVYGKRYGNYILMCETMENTALKEAINLILDNALQSIAKLEETENVDDRS